MCGKPSRAHKVLMSDGSTRTIRTRDGAVEAQRIASETSSGVPIYSVQTQVKDAADNLREGGMNF